MSKLFRTKQALTLAQLARAWSSELVETGDYPKQCEQDLIHELQEDIINGRMDDSGPLRNGARLGLRCIRPDNKAGLVEGRELLPFFGPGKAWILDYTLIMKEAVLDFAQRHQLSPPSWWADADEPSEISTDTKGNVVEPNIGPSAPLRFGKQPRIAEYLSERFPAGVPDPGLYPRQALKSDLLERDPSLKPLDEATLKKAIEKHNARLTKQRS